MTFLKRLRSKSNIFSEFLSFLWKNKLWWLIPIIIVLAIFSIILIFTQSSPIAPFIYTLF
jgi:hypothetical protein